MAKSIDGLTFLESLLVADVAISKLNAIFPAFCSEFLAHQLSNPSQTFFGTVVEIVDDHNFVLIVRNAQELQTGVGSNVSGSTRHQDGALRHGLHGQGQNDGRGYRRPADRYHGRGQEACISSGHHCSKRTQRMLSISWIVDAKTLTSKFGCSQAAMNE